MNQRGIDNPPVGGEWVTAAEAARLLGVKKPTVYSYAAKGILRAQGGGGPGKRSRYLRAEVTRLKLRAEARAGHTAVAAGALRWGEPVLDSSITLINRDQGPIYRGHAATDLAQTQRFETVAELLWSGLLPPPATWPPDGEKLALQLRRGSTPLVTLTHVLTQLSLRQQARYGLTRDFELARAQHTIRALAASLSLLAEPSRFAAALEQPTIAGAVSVSLLGHLPSKAERQAIDAMLILFADHELNASTFAARVAASAGADLHACLVAAMATLSGPRHGGACDRVEVLLADAESLGPRAAVARRLSQGEVPAGFDTGAYPDGDPRTAPLLDLAASFGRVPRSTRETIKSVKELTGATPSCDFGQVVLTQALGLPPGSASALFALGRSAGWVAHVLEQRDSGALIRPRARYVGV